MGSGRNRTYKPSLNRPSLLELYFKESNEPVTSSFSVDKMTMFELSWNWLRAIFLSWDIFGQAAFALRIFRLDSNRTRLETTLGSVSIKHTTAVTIWSLELVFGVRAKSSLFNKSDFSLTKREEDDKLMTILE